jgi:hypothetical protein
VEYFGVFEVLFGHFVLISLRSDMSHPSFLRNPSSIEAVQELEGFPDWEGEQSQGWGDSHPTGDSAPSGAGKAGQELLDTCAGYVRRVTHDEIADAVG